MHRTTARTERQNACDFVLVPGAQLPTSHAGQVIFSRLRLVCPDRINASKKGTCCAKARCSRGLPVPDAQPLPTPPGGGRARQSRHTQLRRSDTANLPKPNIVLTQMNSHVIGTHPAVKLVRSAFRAFCFHNPWAWRRQWPSSLTQGVELKIRRPCLGLRAFWWARRANRRPKSWRQGSSTQAQPSPSLLWKRSTRICEVQQC